MEHEHMRIILDPGHGGTDPGALGKDGYEEKRIALAIALEVRWLLRGAGHEIVMTRDDDRYIGLTARCKMANRWPADLFVSIHLNADPDADLPGDHEARGQEIWIYPAALQSRKLAECVAAEIKAAFPDEPFRGVKEDDLAVCRMTQMPAILIEVGFIDNSETARQLSDPAVRMLMAQSIANGIEKYCQAKP